MSEPQDTTDDAARVRLTHTGPLDATKLLELYVPLPGEPLVTILHTGPATAAARKWARRLEIELVEAPAEDLEEEAEALPMPVVQAQPDGPPAPPPPPAPEVLPAPVPIPLLEPQVEAPSVLAPALVEPALALAPARAPELIVAPSAPEPALVHAPATDPALPWDLTLATAEPAPAHVEIGELLAFPWNTLDEIAQRAAEEDDHHEVIAGAPRRPTEHHPTSLLPPTPHWGLPWPRPVAPAGAVAKVDPTLWHEPERLAAMREDLEIAGAPSFGAVKPEGSGWLKKLSDAG